MPVLYRDQTSTVRSRRYQRALFQFRLDVPLNHERLVARGAFAKLQKRGSRFCTEFFWHAKLLAVLKMPTMTNVRSLVSDVMIGDVMVLRDRDAATATTRGNECCGHLSQAVCPPSIKLRASRAVCRRLVGKRARKRL